MTLMGRCIDSKSRIIVSKERRDVNGDERMSE